MKRIVFALCAVSAAALATPAYAAPTVTSEVNGAPLSYQIYGIGTGPHSPQNVVYGSSPSNTDDANVTFTAGAGQTVEVVISDGFAQVEPGTGSWTSLLIDPTEFDFTAFKFALALNGATGDSTDNVLVEYLLAAPGSIFQTWGTIDGLTAPNVNFELSGATFDAFRLSTVSSGVTFSAIKQMSYSPLNAPPPPPPPAVPEPATWAMMLLGFVGMGMTVRRRTTKALRQLA